MAARKAPPKSTRQSTPPKSSQRQPASASAAQSAKTSARSTVSGPANKGGAAAITDAATAKAAGTESVAASFPHNAAKPSEFGRAAMQPATGQAVEPPH